MPLEKLNENFLLDYAIENRLYNSRQDKIKVRCFKKSCNKTHAEKPFKWMAKGRKPKFFHGECIKVIWRAMEGKGGKKNKSKDKEKKEDKTKNDTKVQR